MVRDDLARATLALRGSPSFTEFVKTLTARRESVVDSLISTADSKMVDVLRGEVRAYDYILKATRDPVP
jgi:hypothetical protein